MKFKSLLLRQRTRSDLLRVRFVLADGEHLPACLIGHWQVFYGRGAL